MPAEQRKIHDAEHMPHGRRVDPAKGENQRGVLASGMVADIVVLNDHPLQDNAATP